MQNMSIEQWTMNMMTTTAWTNVNYVMMVYISILYESVWSVTSTQFRAHIFLWDHFAAPFQYYWIVSIFKWMWRCTGCVLSVCVSQFNPFSCLLRRSKVEINELETILKQPLVARFCSTLWFGSIQFVPFVPFRFRCKIKFHFDSDDPFNLAVCLLFEHCEMIAIDERISTIVLFFLFSRTFLCFQFGVHFISMLVRIEMNVCAHKILRFHKRLVHWFVSWLPTHTTNGEPETSNNLWNTILIVRPQF